MPLDLSNCILLDFSYFEQHMLLTYYRSCSSHQLARSDRDGAVENASKLALRCSCSAPAKRARVGGAQGGRCAGRNMPLFFFLCLFERKARPVFPRREDEHRKT